MVRIPMLCVLVSKTRWAYPSFHVRFAGRFCDPEARACMNTSGMNLLRKYAMRRPKTNNALMLLSALCFGSLPVGYSNTIESDELHVRDIPIPDGATDVTYVKGRGDIRFKVTTDVK